MEFIAKPGQNQYAFLKCVQFILQYTVPRILIFFSTVRLSLNDLGEDNLREFSNGRFLPPFQGVRIEFLKAQVS